MKHKRNLLKRAGLNPHVHTKIQLKKMTKTGLIRLVMKLEKFIVNHAYEMYKAKLPRLRTTKQRSRRLWSSKLGRYVLKRNGNLFEIKGSQDFPVYERTTKQKALPFRKTKRKKLTGAAKAKFLARMNKGRRKKGLKPIRSR